MQIYCWRNDINWRVVLRSAQLPLGIFDLGMTEIYAHFFLFRCSACHGYLAAVCSSSQSNLEPADSHILDLRCQCGWTGELPGFAAMRHWVELGAYVDLAGVPRCLLDYAA